MVAETPNEGTVDSPTPTTGEEDVDLIGYDVYHKNELQHRTCPHGIDSQKLTIIRIDIESGGSTVRSTSADV